MVSLIRNNEGYLYKSVFIFIISLSCVDICRFESVNIPDPECSGPFGVCTPEDKTKLGYAAIAKLHKKMDEDGDGEIEIRETKEYLKEDLQLKNGIGEERQKKFHGSDSAISIDEMWKSWEYSTAYNWTTDEMIVWINEIVKLPEYAENFRRNSVDGQFLPRLVLNENHYYTNILQIKDARHKRMFILKATDTVLFGAQTRPHNLIKDVIMIGALTLSIIFCILTYSKHKQSSDQIAKLYLELDKLNTLNDIALPTRPEMDFNPKEPLSKQNSLDNKKESADEFSSLGKFDKSNSQDDDKSQDQLKHAEQELERMRMVLKKTELRLDTIKYQPPLVLINLLNRTYESEKALLQFKLSAIEEQRKDCGDVLERVCKRQSGFMGAFKIAHSSTLEEIQHKLAGLKMKHQKLKLEQQESTKRWNSIFEMCVRNEQPSLVTSKAISSDTISSQEAPFSSSTNYDQSQRFNDQDDLNNRTPMIRQPAKVGSLNSYDTSERSKYTIGDRISNSSNFKFPIEENKESQNQYQNNFNNVIDKYSNGNLSANERLNNLVIISPTNLPSTSSPQHSSGYSTMPNVNGKIARGSLIHGTNDVFQFSDVDSVQTADFFSKKTPQSSFESDDTYKSNSILPSLIKSKNSMNPKDKTKFLRASFSKLHKNLNQKENETSESLQSLEHSNSTRETFSRTISSLKSKIFNSNKNLFGSQTIKPSQTLDRLKSIKTPEITVTAWPTSMVHLPTSNSSKPQFTIPNQQQELTQEMDQLIDRSQSSTNLNISIPLPRSGNSSNASFTIQNTSSENILSNSTNSISPVATPSTGSSDQKSSSIFKFKAKSKKLKSPKKKK